MRSCPTQVCLWLGANVMVEYSYNEAETLLVSNLAQAEAKMASVFVVLCMCVRMCMIGAARGCLVAIPAHANLTPAEAVRVRAALGEGGKGMAW